MDDDVSRGDRKPGAIRIPSAFAVPARAGIRSLRRDRQPSLLFFDTTTFDRMGRSAQSIALIKTRLAAYGSGLFFCERLDRVLRQVHRGDAPCMYKNHPAAPF